MPPKTVVRRARKSIRERRMKECLSGLTANLESVELKVHKHQKQKRFLKKKRLGKDTLDPVPASVRDGVMTEDLYEVECQLHNEAGLPPPALPDNLHRTHGDGSDQEEYGGPSTSTTTASSERRFGCVLFKALVGAVRAKADRREAKRR